jgi:capsular exopolysaccharide synthesis family protein
MSLRNARDELSLSHYARVLSRRKWWLIVSLAVGLAGSLTYSYAAPRKYTATASVLVEAGNATALSPVAPQSTVAYQQVETDVQLATSAPVKRAAQALAGFPATASAAGSVTSDLIMISSTNTSPKRAATAANAYAAALVSYVRDVTRQNARGAAVSIQTQLNTVQASITRLRQQYALIPDKTSIEAETVQGEITAYETQIATLQGELAQAQIQASMSTGGLVTTAQASVPSAPSSPKKVEAISLSLFGFAILGAALMFVAEALDDSIHAGSDIEAIFPEAPLLGIIPKVDRWKTRDSSYLVSIDQPLSPAAEAYRALRTAIEFRRIDTPLRTIVVSSAAPEEGKTATVANLAVAFARSGQQVLVIDADLRRPRLGSFYHVSEDRGLGSAALGAAALEDCIVRDASIPGLSFLGTGQLPGSPAEFLASRKVGEMLSSLIARYDLVIIDSPPLLPVTDALVLSRYADALMIVVSDQRTGKRALARVRQLCLQSTANLLGVVFNDVAPGGAEAYGGEYDYRPQGGSRASGRHLAKVAAPQASEAESQLDDDRRTGS